MIVLYLPGTARARVSIGIPACIRRDFDMDFQLALNKTELLYEVCAHAFDVLVSIATPTPLPSFLTSFFILFSRAFRPAIPWFRALQLATAAARRAFRPVAFSRARFRRDFAEAIAFGSGPSALPPARPPRRNDGRPASFARAGSFRFRPAPRAPPRSAKGAEAKAGASGTPPARERAPSVSPSGVFFGSVPRSTPRGFRPRPGARVEGLVGRSIRVCGGRRRRSRARGWDRSAA